MSSSLSPDQYGSNRSQSSPEGTASGSQEKSAQPPLNLNFFKSLADKRATREGNPPKRRGPKPDSKPALTRRQELNRQAQRTHRERKELYIKALEDEVLRLKEIYSNVSQDKEKLFEENKKLRDMLAQHGIPFARGSGQDDLASNPSVVHPSSTSPGNSFAPGSHTTFSRSQSTAASVTSSGHPSNFQPGTGDQMRRAPQSPNGKGVDLEQAGIDFVLTEGGCCVTEGTRTAARCTKIGCANDCGFTEGSCRLEKPCMQHMPFLLDRATEADGDPCGHALMASCPPAPFAKLAADTPFGHTYTHDHGDGGNPGQGTWELSKADLATLLDLSKRLDLDGEITPVMAWGMILSHPRFADFKSEDFRKLADELGRKVRCYGFGAVMEEFELRDAFESVLPCEPDTMLY
ncbi:AP-1-like transcription factor [Tolypocladium paradoxum]|uniref:AP-1-like transcription factor n=1 Tax=Tolypocladium paradoxum TaxID=94208 RepID=A0A2S4L244_9HYPO|nr:AP-1-like transcription factor [Tolypocladium paradoxum]